VGEDLRDDRVRVVAELALRARSLEVGAADEVTGDAHELGVLAPHGQLAHPAPQSALDDVQDSAMVLDLGVGLDLGRLPARRYPSLSARSFRGRRQGMAKRMVAYCGLVCSDCEARVATQKGDVQALARLAEKWSAEYGSPMTAEACLCDGCLPATGRKSGYCSQCEIRACAVARKLENCAHCTEYACEKLQGFFKMATKAKPVLDEIHATI